MAVEMQDVSSALAELGRLRFGEMKVEDAMHEIVRSTHAIFDVDGAGLMLADADHHLHNVAVSDDRMVHLEELQIQHREGPCIAAFEDKQLIGAEDLTEEPRWPLFSAAAVQRGVRAVLASPLPYNQDAVGVVTVVSAKSRPWSPEGELALLAFTDLAALLIASMMQSQEKSALASQLQGALDSRQIIEQAKGVLVGRHGITPRAAFEQLRAQARSERRKVSALCAEVVASATKPSPPSSSS
jgi:GAF domain-containing protein